MLVGQKDLNDLGQGQPGPFLQLPRRKATQRMGEHGKGIVGDTQDARHGPSCGHKGLGAKDGSWNPQLLKGDAVVQTAR